MKKIFLSASFFIFSLALIGQKINVPSTYTRQDSLRGMITQERAWWDLLHYDLYISVDPAGRTISGKNIVRYQVLDNGGTMQIDLQPPLRVSRVWQNNQELPFTREGNAHFITMLDQQQKGEVYEVEIDFNGKPHVAVNPPWQGGFIWREDKKGNDFIATSCQGIGASIWWPCKDHTYDEPDNGITLSINCPRKLVAVGNGRLIEIKDEMDKTKTYTWQVINPINSYGVSLSIGDYANFKDTFSGESGELDLDFWVLKENLKKAKSHFEGAHKALEAMEHWFGPYPFYEDSYKLVEVPYLGMEHQSSVAYGNGYVNGYKGIDRSQTGWGLSWDYIILHETAHEWFGNSITNQDQADMWIHEGFSSYAEALYIEYFYGKEAGAAYLKGLRTFTDNRGTVIGDYEVNNRGKDIYEKGANLLHTLRQWIDNDSLWQEILRGLNQEFYHQVVTTSQIEKYIASRSGLDLTAFFDQYLRDFRVPVLEYLIENDELAFRWTNCIEGFDMPVVVYLGDQPVTLQPTVDWGRVVFPHKIGTISVDDDFYVYSHEIRIGKAR